MSDRGVNRVREAYDYLADHWWHLDAENWILDYFRWANGRGFGGPLRLRCDRTAADEETTRIELEVFPDPTPDTPEKVP